MRSFARLALVATAMLMLANSSALAAIDVAGTSATFAWTPSSGPVSYYTVYVDRDGAGFTNVVEEYVATPRVTIEGEFGETIRVCAMAWGWHGSTLLTSAPSPFSEEVRFVDPASGGTQDPTPPSSPSGTPVSERGWSGTAARATFPGTAGGSSHVIKVIGDGSLTYAGIHRDVAPMNLVGSHFTFDLYVPSSTLSRLASNGAVGLAVGSRAGLGDHFRLYHLPRSVLGRGGWVPIRFDLEDLSSTRSRGNPDLSQIRALQIHLLFSGRPAGAEFAVDEMVVEAGRGGAH
jgi:hypothetical protein